MVSNSLENEPHASTLSFTSPQVSFFSLGPYSSCFAVCEKVIEKKRLRVEMAKINTQALMMMATEAHKKGTFSLEIPMLTSFFSNTHYIPPDKHSREKRGQ